ncbi:ankyrin repeat domain-containing protein [Candidatus Babeliales bacterium]|nr:ankyrin repeat domain-containing protein [Candidatus Babeliales bacterium]
MIKITKALLCVLLLNAGLWAASSSSSLSLSDIWEASSSNSLSLSESETEKLTGAMKELSIYDRYSEADKYRIWQQTPLHTAARKGDIPAIITLVVEQGASIQAVDFLGHTPLHCAAIYQHKRPEVFDLLLELGADRYAVDKDGKLAWPERQMLLAAKAGDLAVMVRLYEYDASLIEARDFSVVPGGPSSDVLHYLVLSRNYAALLWACQELKKRGKYFSSCGSHWTPLQLAAVYQDRKAWDIVRQFDNDSRTSWNMAHMEPWCGKYITTYYADGGAVTRPRYPSKSGGCSIQ